MVSVVNVKNNFMKKIFILFSILFLITSCKRVSVKEPIINNNANNELSFEKNMISIKRIIDNDKNNINIGDTIEFGSYINIFTESFADTYRPIKWEVLDKNDDAVLLISKSIIDVYNYNENTNRYIDSNICQYINNILYEKIFSPYEKSLIKNLSVFRENDENKISILNQNEINLYFNREDVIYQNIKKAIATPYVYKRGVNVSYDVTEDNYLCGEYLVLDNDTLKLYDLNYDIVDLENSEYNMYGIRPVVAVDYSAFVLNKKITLGRYEQDDDNTNGKEDIIWKIIYKFDNKYLLHSEKILDVINFTNEDLDELDKYDDDKIYVTYETSDVRKFLLSNFYDESFTNNEKEILSNYQFKTININTINDLGEYGYDNLDDKVFLLSKEEIEYYIDTNRIDQTNSNIINTKLGAMATKYALNKKNKNSKKNSADEEEDNYYFDDYYNYLIKSDNFIGSVGENIGLNNLSPYLLRNVNDNKLNFCQIVENFPPRISLMPFSYNQSGIRPCIVIDSDIVERIVIEKDLINSKISTPSSFNKDYKIFNTDYNVINNRLNKHFKERMIDEKYNSNNFIRNLLFIIEDKIKDDDNIKNTLKKFGIKSEYININYEYYKFDFEKKLGKVVIYEGAYINKNQNDYLIKFNFDIKNNEIYNYEITKFDILNIIKLTDDYGNDITDEHFDDILINSNMLDIGLSLINTHMNSFSIVPMKEEIFDKFENMHILGILPDKNYDFAMNNNIIDNQYNLKIYETKWTDEDENIDVINQYVDVVSGEYIDRYLIKIKFIKSIPEMKNIDMTNASFGIREAFSINDISVEKLTTFDNIYDIYDLLNYTNMKSFKETVFYEY